MAEFLNHVLQTRRIQQGEVIKAEFLNTMLEGLKTLLGQGTKGQAGMMVDQDGVRSRIPISSAGSTSILGRVYAVDYRRQRCLVDPILASADPSLMGQSGNTDPNPDNPSNIWSDLEFQSWFDTNQRMLCWTGGWTMLAPGVAVIVNQVVNSPIPVVVQLLNLTGMPNDTYDGQEYDPEFRMAEPCADIVSPPDPTVLTELPSASAPCAVCTDPNPINHGGCWTDRTVEDPMFDTWADIFPGA